MSETIELVSQEILQSFERSLAASVDFGPGCPDRLAEAIRYSLLSGGKRLRPMLVLHSTLACGSDPSEAMPAACAVEMIHAYSLIHDDLPAMDDDELRRGKPSCHIAFDEATAILAGDALQARAFELLATQIQSKQTAAVCCAELASAAGAANLVGGQSDDLADEPDHKSLESSVRWLEEINQRKTAALLTVSLRLGAIIAGASGDKLEGLTSYGMKIGLAFQIVDDLLDLQGNEEKIGKRTGQDARQGKRTFPALIGAEESRRRANELASEAIAHLDCLGEKASPLIALAHYIVKRDH